MSPSAVCNTNNLNHNTYSYKRQRAAQLKTLTIHSEKGIISLTIDDFKDSRKFQMATKRKLGRTMTYHANKRHGRKTFPQISTDSKVPVKEEKS